MHPEPLPTLEPPHQNAGKLQIRAHRRRVRAAEHAIAQLGREPPQHGGLKQERAFVSVKRREHLVAEILGEVPVISSELTDGTTAIVNASKPESREVQRGGPALGPLS